jgi:hypothetical protein
MTMISLAGSIVKKSGICFLSPFLTLGGFTGGFTHIIKNHALA